MNITCRFINLIHNKGYFLGNILHIFHGLVAPLFSYIENNWNCYKLFFQLKKKRKFQSIFKKYKNSWFENSVFFQYDLKVSKQRFKIQYSTEKIRIVSRIK